MLKKLMTQGKKVMAITLSFALLIGVLTTSQSLLAQEEVPVLTKDDFLLEVVTDNSTLTDLEDQLVDMRDSLENYSASVAFLAQVGGLVPRYNSLYEKSVYTKENAPGYSSLLFGLITTPQGPGYAELIGIIVGAHLALPAEQQSKVLSYDEYLEYNGYTSMFQSMGFKGGFISPQDEYESFVAPVYVGRNSLESGIESLEDGLISAEDAIKIGAGQLYNTLLMMEDLVEILDLTYETSKTNYESGKTRYDNGLLSKISLDISYNDMLKAEINSNSLKRDVDNLRMSMNVMMGHKPTEDFQVVAESVVVTELESVTYYIDEALVQRSEIIANERSREDHEFEMVFVEGIYAKTDQEYIMAVKNEELLELDFANMQNTITIEIYNAYNNVLEKERDLELAYLDLEEARRQYDELAFNVKQGFVTESMLGNLNLLVTNSVNNVSTKSRDYLVAVDSLLNASSFGPGY